MSGINQGRLRVRGKADWPPDARVRPRGGVFTLVETAVSGINNSPGRWDYLTTLKSCDIEAMRLLVEYAHV